MLPPVYQIYTISVFYFSIITTKDYSRRTGCLGWSRVGVVRSPRGLKVTGEQLDSRLSSFWDQDKRHLKEDCGRSHLDEGDAIGKKAWGRGILHLVFLHWHWHTCNQLIILLHESHQPESFRTTIRIRNPLSNTLEVIYGHLIVGHLLALSLLLV